MTQFSTLHELAHALREHMLSADAMKRFVSYVRCASYPDLAAYQRERSRVEKAWPAYAKDPTLSRLPSFFWSARAAPGEEWLRQYGSRLQHALSHMNHHIHPLLDPEGDPETGERRSLQSCRPKAKKGKTGDATQACKSGFPLVNADGAAARNMRVHCSAQELTHARTQEHVRRHLAGAQ